jgi:flagellar assembly factor FliW
MEMKSVINQQFDFRGSIVGFEHLNGFVLSEMDPDSDFYLLRSVEEESIEYLVVSPFAVNRDYEFELMDEYKEELQITETDEVLVLAIITLQKPFFQSTINLLAPLVINIKNGTGRQVILNGSSYAVNASLFPQQQPGRGE